MVKEKKLHRRYIASLFLILMLIPVTGCTVKESYHGAAIMIEENLAAIRVGSDNKATVNAKLGSPTNLAPLDQNRWLYVAQKMRTKSFTYPKPEDMKVIEILFDSNGVVQAVNRLNIDDYVRIKPNENITQTYGRSESILSELFGNIGRFSPGME